MRGGLVSARSDARLDRRRFLQLGAGALLGTQLAIDRAYAHEGRAASAAKHAPARDADGCANRLRMARGLRDHSHLVCVYLQGGADGLALLPPLRDDAYLRLRPQTAVPPDRALPLAVEAGVGLHPAFAALAPQLARGQLRGLTGVGTAGADRSHARADARLHAELRRMAVRWELATPERSALPAIAPPSLRARLATVAAAIGAGEPLAAVLLPVPGFDTHAAQARRLERAFAQLGEELAEFIAALGTSFAHTRVLVLSELGRGLHENRMAGTDDGEAGAALLLSGAQAAGGINAAWPALAPLAAEDAHGIPVQLPLAVLLAELDRELFGAERLEVGRG
jgi:uncharacterized protein (DUF1501 family)